MSAATGSNNTGHGHVYPRPDGVRARCGGPAMCVECSGDYVRQNSREAKHPMTDIDAIRKLSPSDQETLDTLCDIEAYFRKEYAYEVENAGSGGSTIAAGMWKRYFMALYNLSHDLPELIAYGPRLTALQVAFDAKCEELRGMALLKERMWQSESECVELRHHVARLGAKVSALDASLGTVIAERDAAHREKAAAMGLVEGHALTIAKLEAERDAAVREREGLRKALVTLSNASWDAEDVRCFALDALEAALAPPTEQPCATCGGKGYYYGDDGVTGRGPDDREPTQYHCEDCADIRAAIVNAEGRANEFTKRGGLSCEGATLADDRGDRATEETSSDRPAAPISKPVSP